MSNPVTVTAQPGTSFIDVIREFDAPVEAVRRAFVEPDLVAEWMRPDGFTTKSIEYDVRPGGEWSFVHLDPAGTPFAFRGVFHSVGDDELTRTFEFDGWPGHVSLESVRFVDAGDGRTLVSTHSVFQSIDDRDGMLASGMEQGQTEGFARLDALLAD